MIPNWLYMSPSDSPDHPGPILYHSESSEVPYSTNKWLVRNFFCCFLQQTGSNAQAVHSNFCYIFCSPRGSIFLWYRICPHFLSIISTCLSTYTNLCTFNWTSNSNDVLGKDIFFLTHHQCSFLTHSVVNLVKNKLDILIWYHPQPCENFVAF